MAGAVSAKRCGHGVLRAVRSDGLLSDGLGSRAGQDCAENAAIYDAWAAKYNEDVASWGYVLPAVSARMLANALPARLLQRTDAAVLDAGCGTGLLADHLAEIGVAVPLVGLDASEGMVEAARAVSGYRSVAQADLNVELPFADDAFVGATLVGTTTYLDAAGPVLAELCRVVMKGGVVVLTLRSDLEAWERRAEELADDGYWQLVERRGPMLYLPGHPEYAEKLLVTALCYEVLR